MSVSDCPDAYARRSMEAILASKIAVLYGFVIKASPPSIILFNSSISVLLLVTNTMGMSEKLRICEQISKPLFPGSFISKRTRWGEKVFTCSITFEKSVTVPTLYPLPAKRVFSCVCIVRSSSTINILISLFLSDFYIARRQSWPLLSRINRGHIHHLNNIDYYISSV